MFLRCLEILIIGLRLEERKQRADGTSDGPDQGNIDMRSSADLFSTRVNLDNFRILWEELRIGKVAAKVLVLRQWRLDCQRRVSVVGSRKP